MRIIGGKDYYDAGAAWGQDESIVFMRNGSRRLSEIEFHIDLGVPLFRCAGGLIPRDEDTAAAKRRAITRWRPTLNFQSDAGRIEQTAGRVLLAGTLYHGLRVTLTQAGVATVRWLWSFEAMRDLAETLQLGLHEGMAETGSTRAYDANRQGAHDILERRVPLSHWFVPTPLSPAAREALATAGITLATHDPAAFQRADPDHVVRPWAIDQPTLAAMDFAKAVDPYTAYQEIAMWVGGVLPAPGPEMVEISDDKVKIAKHGFHHPTSFRRGKGE